VRWIKCWARIFFAAIEDSICKPAPHGVALFLCNVLTSLRSKVYLYHMLHWPCALPSVSRKLMTGASADSLAGALYSVANAYPYKQHMMTSAVSYHPQLRSQGTSLV